MSKKWYARNDVDLLECKVYECEAGGGITESDLFDTKDNAIKYLVRELKTRMKEYREHIKNLEDNLK